PSHLHDRHRLEPAGTGMSRWPCPAPGAGLPACLGHVLSAAVATTSRPGDYGCRRRPTLMGPLRPGEGTMKAIVQDKYGSVEVFGWCDGSFAEYTCAPEDNLAPKPAAISFEQAAAVPTSGFAALQGLRDSGEVQPGQKVLIIGASGGVGLFAVQLAKAFGAEVTGVCSTTQLDLVKSVGADHVIDYTRDDLADGTRHWDIILDTAGHRSLSQLRRPLT